MTNLNNYLLCYRSKVSFQTFTKIKRFITDHEKAQGQHMDPF